MSSTGGTLGARLGTHAAAKGKFWWIPLGLVVAGGGLFTTVGPWAFPDPRADLGTNLFVSILGLFLTFLGVFAVVSVLHKRHRRVHVHERGIVLERGEQRTEMAWDEVSSLICQRLTVVQYGIPHRIAKHILQTDSGKKIVLDHFVADIESLADEVEHQVTRCLLPKLRARLAAGESLALAPFTLTESSLTHGTKTLPWERVAGAALERGELQIFGRGEPSAWVKISYGKLTNAQALLTLISSYVKAKPA